MSREWSRCCEKNESLHTSSMGQFVAGMAGLCTAARTRPWWYVLQASRQTDGGQPSLRFGLRTVLEALETHDNIPRYLHRDKHRHLHFDSRYLGIPHGSEKCMIRHPRGWDPVVPGRLPAPIIIPRLGEE